MLTWCPIMYRIFGVARLNSKKTHCHVCQIIYGLVNIDPKKFCKLPSAARFCTKRFWHIDFWTSFLSISQKFFESCANSNRRNNKINLCNNNKKEQHNGLTKNGAQKTHFLDLTFWHVTPPKSIFFVLSNKTEICHLAQKKHTQILLSQHDVCHNQCQFHRAYFCFN